jgi:hypothetical protein
MTAFRRCELDGCELPRAYLKPNSPVGLAFSKQVISRYEETEYQTVAISRLQEILDAIGVKALVTLTA